MSMPEAANALSVTVLALSLVSCDSSPRATADGAPAGSSPPTSGVEIVSVGQVPGDTRALIRSEHERAKRDGRDLVVYVGAPWCEPCQRFHKAAAAGELDRAFPTLRLLEFDRDKHESALGDVDCLSKLIPLLAVPTPDGRCSDIRVEGAIKGEGAVGFIVPRLEKVLRDAHGR